ncbi:hypothetical protein EG328_003088 [Venturia inaequalis]|uniref:Uncharacterized protein n=1 Tax=Venturia inaequalis TaxID=5025 RepID=A0A8H3VI74_VENIN|nr:hypothetical protein EG328_003088 [Venturia inaequalis]
MRILFTLSATAALLGSCLAMPAAQCSPDTSVAPVVTPSTDGLEVQDQANACPSGAVERYACRLITTGFCPRTELSGYTKSCCGASPYCADGGCYVIGDYKNFDNCITDGGRRKDIIPSEKPC